MAYFEGTIQEFIKFLGPYAKNKVNSLTKRHRKTIGACQKEGCCRTENLQAAHIRGFDRISIIANILSNYTDNGIVRINLLEFVEKFTAAHDPVDRVILILCESCHREYDALRTPNEEEENEEGEGREVEREVQSYISRTNAIQILMDNGQLGITPANSNFSNINRAVPKWWVDPNKERFDADFHLILNNHVNRRLFYFVIKQGAISPDHVFRIKNENQYTFTISVNDRVFKTESGFDFAPYLVKECEY